MNQTGGWKINRRREEIFMRLVVQNLLAFFRRSLPRCAAHFLLKRTSFPVSANRPVAKKQLASHSECPNRQSDSRYEIGRAKQVSEQSCMRRLYFVLIGFLRLNRAAINRQEDDKRLVIAVFPHYLLVRRFDVPFKSYIYAPGSKYIFFFLLVSRDDC